MKRSFLFLCVLFLGLCGRAQEEKSVEQLQFVSTNLMYSPDRKLYGFNANSTLPGNYAAFLLQINSLLEFGKDKFNYSEFMAGFGLSHYLCSNDNVAFLKGQLIPYLGLNSYDVANIQLSTASFSKESKTEFSYGIIADVSAGFRVASTDRKDYYITLGYQVPVREFKGKNAFKYGSITAGLTTTF